MLPVELSLGEGEGEGEVWLGRFGSAAVLTAHWLALGGAKLPTKVLGCSVHQPISIHQAQVPHVAAGGVQELIEDHVGRLGLEEHRGGVDGYRLVGVQGCVAPVRLQLCGIHKQPMGQAAPHAPCVCPT